MRDGKMDLICLARCAAYFAPAALWPVRTWMRWQASAASLALAAKMSRCTMAAGLLVCRSRAGVHAQRAQNGEAEHNSQNRTRTEQNRTTPAVGADADASLIEPPARCKIKHNRRPLWNNRANEETGQGKRRIGTLRPTRASLYVHSYFFFFFPISSALTSNLQLSHTHKYRRRNPSTPLRPGPVELPHHDLPDHHSLIGTDREVPHERGVDPRLGLCCIN